MAQTLFQIQDFPPQLLGMLETEGSYLRLLWKLPGQSELPHSTFNLTYEGVNMGREKPSPLPERSTQCPSGPGAQLRLLLNASQLHLSAQPCVPDSSNCCFRDHSPVKLLPGDLRGSGLGSDCTFGTLGFNTKTWFISSFIHS